MQTTRERERLCTTAKKTAHHWGTQSKTEFNASSWKMFQTNFTRQNSTILLISTTSQGIPRIVEQDDICWPPVTVRDRAPPPKKEFNAWSRKTFQTNFTQPKSTILLISTRSQGIPRIVEQDDICRPPVSARDRAPPPKKPRTTVKPSSMHHHEKRSRQISLNKNLQFY